MPCRQPFPVQGQALLPVPVLGAVFLAEQDGETNASFLGAAQTPVGPHLPLQGSAKGHALLGKGAGQGANTTALGGQSRGAVGWSCEVLAELWVG